MKSTSSSGKGNALFLILIAVALFAALAYAVTQSGRGGSGGTNRETASLTGSQIVQYAGQVSQAVQRMLLVNGCTPATLSFYSTRWNTPAHYGTAPAGGNDGCHVFYPGGGSVTWQAPPVATGATEYLVNARIIVDQVGTTAGSPAPGAADITIFVPVPQAVCEDINRQVGVANPPPSHTSECWTFPSNPTQAFATGAWGDQQFGFGGNRTALSGKWMACYACTGGPPYPYYFYSVIAAQ